MASAIMGDNENGTLVAGIIGTLTNSGPQSPAVRWNIVNAEGAAIGTLTNSGTIISDHATRVSLTVGRYGTNNSTTTAGALTAGLISIVLINKAHDHQLLHRHRELWLHRHADQQRHDRHQ